MEDEINYSEELKMLRQEIQEIKNTASTPESQRRAAQRYNKKQNKLIIRVPDKEVELWEHLKSHSNMNLYIKTLIARDLGYKNWGHFQGKYPSDGYVEEWNTEKKKKEFRSRLLQFTTIIDLTNFINQNKLSKWQWDEVENIFCLDEDPSELASDLYKLGVLPWKAWTRNTIIHKVNDQFPNSSSELNKDLNKRPLKNLKHELLIPLKWGPHITGLDSRDLNSHVKFYNFDYVNSESLFGSYSK